MRNAAYAALIAAILTACASEPRKPIAVSAPPAPAREPGASPMTDAFGVVDPWAETDVTAAAPAGWDQGTSDDLPMTTVAAFFHPSRRARIFVATVPSGNALPEDRVLAFIPEDFRGAVTSSLISVGADREWASISWTAHESPRRAKGAQGRIYLRDIGGRPDLQVLVSGLWPQELSPQMAAPFEAVVKSIVIR